MVAAKMSLAVEDMHGQSRRRASGVPREATVNELIESLRSTMHLPDQDAQGRPIQYGAIRGDGEMLNATDQVGDVLEDEETIVLAKSVSAGC